MLAANTASALPITIPSTRSCKLPTPPKMVLLLPLTKLAPPAPAIILLFEPDVNPKLNPVNNKFFSEPLVNGVLTLIPETSPITVL